MMSISPTLHRFASDALRRPTRRWARHSRRIVLFTVIVDAIMIMVSVLTGLLGRTTLSWFQEANDLAGVVTSLVWFLVVGWLAALAIAGTYLPKHLGAGTIEYLRVLTASIMCAGGLGVACYLGKFQLSRGFFALTFLTGIPMLLIGRWAARRTVQRLRQRGRLTLTTLLVGMPRPVSDLAKVLRRESWLGYRVAGVLLPNHADADRIADDLPVLGRTDDLLRVVDTNDVDVVIFGPGAFGSSMELRRLAWKLEDRQAQVIVVPSVSDVSEDRLHMRPVGGLPLVHVERPQGAAAGRWMKRLFDIVGSITVMIIAAPLVLAVSIAIMVESGRPVLFRQTRVGRDNDLFECVKFRSMVVGADALLPELLAENESDGLLFKIADDPRVTRVGKFIRRYSLDELPQIWNVLRGEMSLVGPRPALPREVAAYDEDMLRRLRVRPGLTGLWQVSGRSDLSWEDTVRLDLYYVDNWSLVQDLAILARTVKVVVKPSGAY